MTSLSILRVGRSLHTTGCLPSARRRRAPAPLPRDGVVGSSQPEGGTVKPTETLDTLRAEARDELDAEIERRCRGGEDPWQFIHELPTVDERVVRILRADAIALLGLE